MKKIIIAMENKNLIKKLKNNKKINLKYIQYREGILEILEKTNKIDFIFIDENLPGEISIEELIKKIKIKNNKINIIFFLKKANKEKENKLKKLGIKNIYLNNKINKNKIINNLFEKNKLNKKQIIKINKYKINKKNYLKNENKILTILGEKNAKKYIIINLLLIYLINKNKKILLINLNKKIEKNYLIILGKKYLKNKIKNNKINNFENIEIKLNRNINLILNLEKVIKGNLKGILNKFFYEYIKKYDYVIVDMGKESISEIKQFFIEKSNKNILVIKDKRLGIEGIKKLVEYTKKEKRNNPNSLHIIQNEYNLFSINHIIVKQLFKNYAECSKFYYQKKFNNLAFKIQKNKKIKLNKIINKKIEKILK